MCFCVVHSQLTFSARLPLFIAHFPSEFGFFFDFVSFSCTISFRRNSVRDVFTFLFHVSELLAIQLERSSIVLLTLHAFSLD